MGAGVGAGCTGAGGGGLGLATLSGGGAADPPDLKRKNTICFYTNYLLNADNPSSFIFEIE